MQRKQIYLTAIVFTCLGLLAIVPFAQERAGPLRLALGDQQYLQCGLDKLTLSEQESLIQFLTTGPTVSFTHSSAERYLEKKGWRKVRILGATASSPDDDDFRLIAWDRYQIYSLDPFIVPQLPEPGIYWVKNTLSSWTLLDANAEEATFTAREIAKE